MSDRFFGKKPMQGTPIARKGWVLTKTSKGKSIPAVVGVMTTAKGERIGLFGGTPPSGKKDLGEVYVQYLDYMGIEKSVRPSEVGLRWLKKNPPMYAYVVNYLKTDRGQNVRTVVVKASSEEEAIERARKEVGGFYDVGGVDRLSLAEAKRKSLIGNPPMYAHHLRERKTHGLSLKQMRRLYAMVSRGSQKAITFARNVLGIPFDETPSQVKAVVKHHVLDLAERKVRRNPMEYDVLRDKFEVMGGPITDRMQVLLRKIYNMRDAGKSRASIEPLIREYKRLQSIVAPLKSNRRRRK